MKKAILIEKSDKWLRYRLACDCDRPECDVHIDFEVENEHSTLWMTFYKRMRYADWWGIGDDHWWLWFKRMQKRVKGASKLLWNGEIEVEEEMVFLDKEHIDSFIKILEEGKAFGHWERD